MKILIDTDWFSAIQDLQPSKQKEVLMAILNYPNGDSDTNLWKKTILPNLEKGKISYFNKLQNLKQNNPQKSNKKNPESVSESDIGSVSESSIDSTIREDKSREDINNIKNKFNINSIIYVNGQYFDEFPKESMPLLKKHWLVDEIENIRKDLACKPEHQTTIAKLLLEYPPKPKKKAYGEQKKVLLTDEEYAKLQELYGRRFENAIQKLDSYIASYNKKYASHYAVMRKNNWLYTEIFKEDWVPSKPQVADMSKFVRAKPLGEEND